MDVNYRLNLELMHYWCPGTGKGSGSYVDAVVDLDEKGCPFVAGKMLKGILRDAVYRTSVWNSAGWNDDYRPLPERIVEIIFGSSAYEKKTPNSSTTPGIIRVGNASLKEDVKEWLSRNNEHRKALFRELYSTAISSGTGAAKKGSLRGKQVVIPLELKAELSIVKSLVENSGELNSPAFNWVLENHKVVLETALPLMRAVGSGRTRGLGRVNMTMEAE